MLFLGALTTVFSMKQLEAAGAVAGRWLTLKKSRVEKSEPVKTLKSKAAKPKCTKSAKSGAAKSSSAFHRH